MKSKSQMIAESVVYNSGGKQIGRGSGLLARSKTQLQTASGYGEAEG